MLFTHKQIHTRDLNFVYQLKGIWTTHYKIKSMVRWKYVLAVGVTVCLWSLTHTHTHTQTHTHTFFNYIRDKQVTSDFTPTESIPSKYGYLAGWRMNRRLMMDSLMDWQSWFDGSIDYESADGQTERENSTGSHNKWESTAVFPIIHCML